jgi:hypothetical protein
MDINDDDDQTVGCAIAHAARADFLSNSDFDDISDNDYDSSCAETCYPVGLKSDCGGQGSVLLVNATEKKNHSSTLADTCNNLLYLSDKLKFLTSKFTVRDGNQFIDVSSAACGPSSTIPIGSHDNILHIQVLCTSLIQFYSIPLIKNLILMMRKRSCLL